jgi:hypothetical protein
MDLEDINKAEYQEQGPRKGIVIIVITILLGTNGLLLWQFFDKKNSLDLANQTIVTTTAEKDALQVQLNQFKAEYEKIKSENAGLQNQLSEKDEEIKAKVAEIQKLIRLGGPSQIARAKAELAKLKEMNDIYSANIDSLKKITIQLQQENQNLSSNLSQEMSKNENLSAENTRLYSKVTAGSVLKAENIITQGLRYRSNAKQVLTIKANQVQTIRTQFTLAENKVIDKGPVDLYFRVTGPDGMIIMSPSKETFKSGGQDLTFTLKETVDYSNKETPVMIMWTKGSGYLKGNYKVDIYHLGQIIGSSQIDLK